MLKRSVSTIWDEIKRNSVKGVYDPDKAQHKAYVRRLYAKYQSKKIISNEQLQKFVDDLLYDDQSPEAIAGRLKNHKPSLSYISKDSIYRYLKSWYGYKPAWHRYQLKKKRRGGKRKLKKRNDRTFIDKRPLYINNRRRIGDAEGDFIVSGKSGKGVLLVIEDRKLRTVFLERVLQPKHHTITNALKKIKKRYSELKSMTTDNDLLFEHHQYLEKKLNIKIYFCFPGHMWEKGGIENRNGWIRKYIPKSSDISKYSKRFVRQLEEKHNRKIMKILNFKTPQEALNNYRKRKQRMGR